ncbi:MAG: hypothetical protein L0191_02570 [Acidobacteria bacterium]|nr:hypothetical protein [Acidobacteriota bacterium]
MSRCWLPKPMSVSKVAIGVRLRLKTGRELVEAGLKALHTLDTFMSPTYVL